MTPSVSLAHSNETFINVTWIGFLADFLIAQDTETRPVGFIGVCFVLLDERERVDDRSIYGGNELHWCLWRPSRVCHVRWFDPILVVDHRVPRDVVWSFRFPGESHRWPSCSIDPTRKESIAIASDASAGIEANDYTDTRSENHRWIEWLLSRQVQSTFLRTILRRRSSFEKTTRSVALPWCLFGVSTSASTSTECPRIILATKRSFSSRSRMSYLIVQLCCGVFSFGRRCITETRFSSSPFLTRSKSAAGVLRDQSTFHRLSCLFLFVSRDKSFVLNRLNTQWPCGRRRRGVRLITGRIVVTERVDTTLAFTLNILNRKRERTKENEQRTCDEGSKSSASLRKRF